MTRGALPIVPDPLSAAEVAQVASNIARRVLGLMPLFPNAAVCAQAATCACSPADNLALHRLLLVAPIGSALVCAAEGRCDGGYFGELMALDALNRGLAGLIIHGSIRDSEPIAASGFSVFHTGSSPVQCRKETVGSVGLPVLVGGVEIESGDQIIADRDAILVVPRVEWPKIEAGARAVRARELEIRRELEKGRPLAELISLPLETQRRCKADL
jgi:4-hydroxy-4-methyl-2-oxoglutarate aldolase